MWKRIWPIYICLYLGYIYYDFVFWIILSLFSDLVGIALYYVVQVRKEYNLQGEEFYHNVPIQLPNARVICLLSSQVSGYVCKTTSIKDGVNQFDLWQRKQ